MHASVQVHAVPGEEVLTKEVLRKDANNLIAAASKLEVTWTWTTKATKIMSNTGETRLHFEGVLDKHGKRFFEVGKLNNISRRVDPPSHIRPNVFCNAKRNKVHQMNPRCYNFVLQVQEESNDQQFVTMSREYCRSKDRRGLDQGCLSVYHALKISLEDNFPMIFDSQLLIEYGMSSKMAFIRCK